jgi:hypothetical protein
VGSLPGSQKCRTVTGKPRPSCVRPTIVSKHPSLDGPINSNRSVLDVEMRLAPTARPTSSSQIAPAATNAYPRGPPPGPLGLSCSCCRYAPASRGTRSPELSTMIWPRGADLILPGSFTLILSRVGTQSTMILSPQEAVSRCSYRRTPVIHADLLAILIENIY